MRQSASGQTIETCCSIARPSSVWSVMISSRGVTEELVTADESLTLVTKLP